MKNYNITVNGNMYQVAVEEVAQGAAYVAPTAPIAAPVPMAAPAPVRVPVAPAPVVAPASNGTAGGTKVSAPMPGKILDIKVNVGDSIKKGAVLVILEAMKMENEIVASNDGVVASINVAKNQSVEPGDLIATIN